MKFDPNQAATEDSGIFGLPYEAKDSKLIYLPIPWDATTSYRAGTHRGPDLILAASRQLDLFDLVYAEPYAPGWYLAPAPEAIFPWNVEARKLAEAIIERGGRIEGNSKLESALKRVNQLSDQLNTIVYRETSQILTQGKIAAIIGGEHSVPFGAIQAAAEKFGPIGILHFDAHSDTREAYEGFVFSHASIMRNVLNTIPSVEKLVQVGIRDFCQEEFDFIRDQGARMEVFFDRDIQSQKMNGRKWADLTNQILENLPKNIWISFDIDGLDPRFCPNTGTPVPGGLEFSEAVFLIEKLAESGRRIIGFDLNEVAPHPDWPKDHADEWDGNVAARLLYKLSGATMASQNLISFRERE